MVADRRSSSRPSYAPCPTKRSRRTKAEMDRIRGAIYDALCNDNPMTVRQVFYRMVSEGVIDKTEGEYKSTIVRLLGQMRRRKVIPYGWISDSTRWMRKPRSFDSLEDALQHTARTYRRSLWACQPHYVEVWLEKNALAGVLYEETSMWDVPLMVVVGYSSITYLYEAAENIAECGKPAFLYYFGDNDPSGVDIDRFVQRELRSHAPDAEIHFERVAVTPEQIKRWDLPTRPTKSTDSRSKKFRGESVEVDAIPSDRLRELVRDCIQRHVSEADLESVKRVEELERQTLAKVAANWGVA